MVASRTAQRQADTLDALRERIERRGVRASHAITLIARAAAQQDFGIFQSGSMAASAANAVITERFKSLLIDGAVQADLTGRFSVIQRAAPRMRRRNFAFEDETNLLARRMELDARQLELLRNKYNDRAVFATANLTAATEQRVQEAVATSFENRETLRQGQTRIRNAFDASGVSSENPFLLETIWRTQMQIAFSAGRWNASQDPAVQEILWGYEYVTVGDDRVRPSHAVLDGLRRPKDDPIWDTITPPNGWNCRCTIIEIFNGDELAESTDVPGATRVGDEVVIPGPDPGFDFNPGVVLADVITVGAV